MRRLLAQLFGVLTLLLVVRLAIKRKIKAEVSLNRLPPFLLSDIHQITQKLKKAKQGNFKIDESRSGLYYKCTKAFLDNTELEATVTYKGTDARKYVKAVTPDAIAVRVNLPHSLIKSTAYYDEFSC
jgi:hypothetical protein